MRRAGRAGLRVRRTIDGVMRHESRSSTTARSGLAGLSAVVALAVGLVACGTIPPDTPTPSASRTAGTSTSPAPTPAKPSTGTPAPPGPAASKAPSVWVGRFEGSEVKVPYGHGATVSFTFDDGPSPTYTPQVLALLAQHHVPAVFCLIGTQARGYPKLVRQEVAAGHRLCDHSRDHDLNMNSKGKAYVAAEVADGLADIRRAAPGAPVDYYRQPGGFWSPAVVTAMDANGLHPLRWTDDPRDWSRPGSRSIVRTVVKRLRPGAVILMHDGGGDRSQSVRALRFLLTALMAAGWRPVVAPVVTLSPAAAAKPE